MVNALVVYAHPCHDSFVAALKDQVVAGLEAAGHAVDLCDLYAEGFDARLTAAEHAAHRADPSTKPHLAPWIERLGRCDVLVLVHPTWWGAQPAILKGWFERVWVHGVAVRLREDGRPPEPLLRNVRRVIAVTTHGSSKWLNAVQGEAGKRLVKRALRGAVGARCRIEWRAMYTVDRSTIEQRRAFLAAVRQRFERLR